MLELANVGECVKEAQYLRRMKTKALSEKLGETRQAVYYLRKQKSASIHKVQTLAYIFDMSISDFLNLSKTPVSGGLTHTVENTDSIRMDSNAQ